MVVPSASTSLLFALVPGLLCGSRPPPCLGAREARYAAASLASAIIASRSSFVEGVTSAFSTRAM
jgi:hypothetical protein